MTTRRIASATRTMEIRNAGKRFCFGAWFDVAGTALGLEEDAWQKLGYLLVGTLGGAVVAALLMGVIFGGLRVADAASSAAQQTLTARRLAVTRDAAFRLAKALAFGRLRGECAPM